MIQYFLIDPGKSMPRWCQTHPKKDGSGFEWIYFKGRRIDLQTSTVLAVAEGHTMEDAFSSVPDEVAKLEQDLASLHLLDPWSEQGWLSPTGKFYGCRYYNHDDLAYALLRTTPHALENSGWVRVHEEFYVHPASRRLSRAQIRVLLELGFIDPPDDNRRHKGFQIDRSGPAPRFAMMPSKETLTDSRFGDRLELPTEAAIGQIKDRMRGNAVLSAILDLPHEDVLDVGPGTWTWLLHWDDFDIGCPDSPNEILLHKGMTIYMTSGDTLEIEASASEGIGIDHRAEAFLKLQLASMRKGNDRTPKTNLKAL